MCLYMQTKYWPVRTLTQISTLCLQTHKHPNDSPLFPSTLSSFPLFLYGIHHCLWQWATKQISIAIHYKLRKELGMCCICRFRFLYSVYRLIHHSSAKHPCALGPWWVVVLAPLSITPCLPKPCARCAGGGMCCRGRSPLPQTLSASPRASVIVAATTTVICQLNGAFRAYV